jgi:glucan 1,3-beta-glucosidase
MGFIQTETPYYQTNPDATYPFTTNVVYSNPPVTTGQSAWGLRIKSSELVYIYGAGLYSFSNNYSTDCSTSGDNCQESIFSIEESIVQVYNLITVGTTNMISEDGHVFGPYSDNFDGFTDEIAYYAS